MQGDKDEKYFIQDAIVWNEYHLIDKYGEEIISVDEKDMITYYTDILKYPFCFFATINNEQFIVELIEIKHTNKNYYKLQDELKNAINLIRRVANNEATKEEIEFVTSKWSNSYNDYLKYKDK